MSIAKAKSPALRLTEEDMQMMLACEVHKGTNNCEKDMEKYVSGREGNGIHIINLARTWEKLMLAARIIVAQKNPKDVVAISSRPYGQRAVLKFGQYTGANYLAGRFTPGAFTNQIQPKFQEPTLLIVTDPRTDHQPIKEASYANIPVIALCDTDSPVKFVDVAIPCNNKNKRSIALIYWLLAREILRMRPNGLTRKQTWDVKVDLFFYRDPDQIAKDEKAKEAEAKQKGKEDLRVFATDLETYGAYDQEAVAEEVDEAEEEGEEAGDEEIFS
mmetsp:Transcript_4395/g.6470  ORF Transcript_4395/g.6470 Transcript_4395/m.6470 type:complete len:273 (+) Transcript_4395:59-877(+)|eukprot:CAMPEP_0117432004 /NCGR_PEP_ID=MMETSP0758-20121206/11541_1 /TAXON_ID=63605 /ORGANISM="Percolomonas cosmopolitus, Strain AE-1 (ATCC 50343)" /LENGTH=272 /DNA_ID=CAMNT_0005221585 /DNA_START=25 /DNA_END=843 /DNA_ORIENTATION=+